MNWKTITAPPDVLPPSPMTMRVQSIPVRHYFAEHTHEWNQLVYAISGVLMVAADGQSFAISPDQAAWIPPGSVHSVGSFLGAEYHSLWLADSPGGVLSRRGVTIFGVSPLLRALIVEAAAVHEAPDTDGYFGRVYQLILDQLRRIRPISSVLAWPTSAPLLRLCETLYSNPADSRGPDEWGMELGMSGRTLARRFFAETGLTLRTWRRRLKSFRAIELLENGFDVTSAALELGYSSTSAFVYAFRSEMQCSPLAYMRTRGSFV
ncbi:AraC family transcriptional regulator [Parapusillimonas granuli]|uniref:Helix-turn-helix transcriptional regulator n=1 Tax=Parapusillimonas granuli TaxID=380911 RepID=A0A853FU97_9BURK|nr:helix-turn-helix transcriptional regulator [Parapusillimonas granuli]MBB5213449.1 AraC-like DNA-binding protein [Parapusillimonas granuli]NYT48288.1 helix-turn-helix transcriptional regulator [Parapusillimonas granuli]